jgi:formylglycine-generating enzyme
VTRARFGSAPSWLVYAGVLGMALAVACQAPAPPEVAGTRRAVDAAAAPPERARVDASAAAEAEDAAVDAESLAREVDAAPLRSDPMALHKDTKDELLALLDPWDPRADGFLRATFGIDGPWQMNQGNKAIARHTTSREECLAGLADIVLQTPDQRATCGADNMVPVFGKGNKPSYCIDVFEFPNRACELPIVWASPSAANAVCKLQGKRLCAQGEWQLACRADPEGGKDRRYAYGDVLDLDVCNTHRSHRQRCVTSDAKSAWATCGTDTEPSGAFPRCRSRFGVFDQHGNVAEAMVRKDVDGKPVSQLKGSAWFYSEIAREPDRPIPESTPYKESAHSDTCNFDPRWHVESLDLAVHVNYHLGFRCCKSL